MPCSVLPALQIVYISRALPRHVFVDVQHFALSLFANELPYAIGGVRVARFLPCAVVLAAPLQHDFAVGAGGVQDPLRFLFLAACLPGADDAPA